jgi:hypothetical protein
MQGSHLPGCEEAPAQGRPDVLAGNLRLLEVEIPPAITVSVSATSYHSWNGKATLQQERPTGRLSKPHVGMCACPTVG